MVFIKHNVFPKWEVTLLFVVLLICIRIIKCEIRECINIMIIDRALMFSHSRANIELLSL